MELYHVSTTEQVADMFTKALPSETLKKQHQVFARADDVTVKLSCAQVGAEGVTRKQPKVAQSHGNRATYYKYAGAASASQD